MSIVSAAFVVYISIVMIAYYLVPKKWQWGVLLCASYLFYSFSNIRYLCFLLATTVTTYWLAQRLENLEEIAKMELQNRKASMDKEQRKQYRLQVKKKKKCLMLLAVVGNLMILVVLKYGNFILQNAGAVIGKIFPSVSTPVLDLLLPLGISFYTLQAIGYVLDVYKEQTKADRNFFQYALFLSYFPQIIQGPISRHSQLAHQLYEKHSFDYERVTKGMQLILWGFIKKLVVADRVGILVDTIFKHWTLYPGAYLLLTATAFGLQVYCDFSGGMDIARGISQVLGIELTLNFERPYFACSIEEFWRRWHITLGAFMREYVFYPVSLSKACNRLGKKARKRFGNYIGKKIPTFLAMFLVFILVGIWHGASWKYIGYGLYNGTIIVSSILLEPVYEKIATALHMNRENKTIRFLRMIRTCLICSMGRFFSRAASFKVAVKMMLISVGRFTYVEAAEPLTNFGLTKNDWILLLLMILVLLAVGILQEKGIRIRDWIGERHIIIRWVTYLAAILLVLIYGIYGPGCSSEGFIYEQF